MQLPDLRQQPRKEVVTVDMLCHDVEEGTICSYLISDTAKEGGFHCRYVVPWSQPTAEEEGTIVANIFPWSLPTAEAARTEEGMGSQKAAPFPRFCPLYFPSFSFFSPLKPNLIESVSFFHQSVKSYFLFVLSLIKEKKKRKKRRGDDDCPWQHSWQLLVNSFGYVRSMWKNQPGNYII